jgi:hypothetical protein
MSNSGFIVQYTFFNNTFLIDERCTNTEAVSISMLKSSAFGHMNILKRGGEAGPVQCTILKFHIEI